MSLTLKRRSELISATVKAVRPLISEPSPLNQKMSDLIYEGLAFYYYRSGGFEEMMNNLRDDVLSVPESTYQLKWILGEIKLPYNGHNEN